MSANYCIPILLQGLATVILCLLPACALAEDKENSSDPQERILIFRGAGFQRLGVREAAALLKDHNVETSDITGFRWRRLGHSLTRRPSRRTIGQCRSIALIDIHNQALGSRLPGQLMETVKKGATLSVFGGPFAFGKGEYKGSLLEELLPAKSVGVWDTVKLDKPQPMLASEECRKTFPVDWSTPPTVEFMQKVELKKEAEVLIEAGGLPVLSRWNVGKGFVYAFTGLPFGTDEKGFWNWSEWPKFLSMVFEGTSAGSTGLEAMSNTELVRYEGRQLPKTFAESKTTDWNLNNLQYPDGAVVIEDLDGGWKGLRIGDRSAKQVGRYTATLRELWDPEVPAGTVHIIRLRMAVNYHHSNKPNGFGGFSLNLSPQYGAAVDISRFRVTDKEGRIRLMQRVNGTNQKVDLTDTARKILGKWNATDLHTYSLTWKTPTSGKGFSMELHIDGKKIVEFQPAVFGNRRNGIGISFEYGAPFGGTALIEFVEWRQTYE